MFPVEPISYDRPPPQDLLSITICLAVDSAARQRTLSLGPSWLDGNTLSAHVTDRSARDAEIIDSDPL